MFKSKWFNMVAVSTVTALVLGGCNSNSSSTQSLDLSIIHMNDVHSHVTSEDMDLEFNGTEVEAQIGGYPRAVTKIKQLQTAKENTLTLNAGDTFQGTMYYSFFKGEADSTMMNMINWDAMALGNHEFDDGDAHLASYLSQLTTLNKNTILAANIEAPVGNPLADMWSPYVIKEFANGAKVGIIGIDIVGKTKNSSNPSEEIEFSDEVQTAQKYIDELTAKGINKIVLLSHVG